jgi:hypothetical protein
MPVVYKKNLFFFLSARHDAGVWCGFVTLNSDAPISDPNENNEPYTAMAKKLAVTPA